jgi:lysophospholipid acyltransferase (LPLAT)-like uncharacterized protein
MLPAPFAKAALFFGDPLHVSTEEDDDAAATRIETAINDAERRAWAMLGVKPREEPA